MTVKEIAGVRELTAQECTEINGGGWYIEVCNPFVWLLNYISGQDVRYFNLQMKQCRFLMLTDFLKNG